ncbi:MAG: DUF2188 domain-containing protein [Anaerolineae bacterium]|nr:DUF2188 domain-containing protein [Anaerolineae bacterium]
MAKKEAVKKNVVVSARRDGTWAVKREGARCATKTLDTREEAEAFARQLAAEEGVEVIVEG